MLLTALSLVLVGQPTELRLARNPDIHGDQVVFNYAADLWTMNRNDGLARRLTSHPGTESAPRFSPDGKWIAFTASYDGNPDVYVMPSEGGEPKRLTFTPDAEVVLEWTPDGKVGFRTTAQSQWFTMASLWTVDPKGGIPHRTKLAEIFDGAFSPDGNVVAYSRNNSHTFNWRRYRGGTQGRIGFFDLRTNAFSEIPSGRENRWQPVYAGNKVYYIGDKDFGTRNLFEWDVQTRRERRLTDFRDADVRNPSSDGKTLIYERNGALWTMDIASGKIERIGTRAISDFPNSRPRLRNLAAGISNLALSPSSVRVAAEARGDIFSIPVRNGDTRNLTNTQGVRETQPAWSPDGQTVAFLTDQGGEQNFGIVNQKGGEVKILKKPVNHFVRAFEWMPDSKTLLYRTQDLGIHLFDTKAETSTLVYQSEWQAGANWDISADGSWIAYTGVGDNLQGALYLYNVAEKKSYKVTDGYFSDDAVSFDLSGKYLYFTSGRTFIPDFNLEIALNFAPNQRVYMLPLTADLTNPLINTASDEEPEPKPAAAPAAAAPAPASTAPAAEAPKAEEPKGLKIDMEGIADRALPLPWGPGNYPFIVGVNNGVLAFVDGQLQLFSLNSRQSVPVYAGPLFGASFNAKRNAMVVNTGQGLAVQRIAPGTPPEPVRTNGVEMMWDPKAEYRQILREAWRFQRDVFYDPKMLGLDWDAIWKQYEAMLDHVHHRADLNYVIGQMIGELGTGHAYVSGGEMGDMGAPTPIGSLGANYVVEGKNVRFGKIYRGLNFEEGRRGPLGEPGLNVKEGDYLLAIEGKPVTSGQDLHAHLVNRVGRTVQLTINSTPSMTGARTIRVRPIASEQQLRYITWVENNRKAVAAATNGRVGYIHVPDTATGGMIEFIKGYYSQSDKDAWIIDERFNGGGFIPTFFVDFLKREVEAKMKNRNFKDIAFPTQILEGPKVMLVNEYAGSGGDMLPWLFKKEGLGPLIGKRTWGGLVGIQGGLALVDGGNVTSPGFGIYDPVEGKWVAENTGIDPDIDVDARPDLIAAGRDPQLERAIDEIKKLMARNPGRKFKTPAFPRPTPGR